MALSGLEVLGSFLTGVQEQSQKYDEDLAKRIKELADKGPSDTAKSKFTAEYADYKEDKKKLEAIQAVGIDSDRGQMLAGGYDSMQDYLDARANARLAGEDLYHEMFTIGEEPKYTPADYGLTNIRDDGSMVTTAGQMFDQFFRPEVHKERIGELTTTPTSETVTTYRRGKNDRSTEDIQKSRESVIARAVALESAGYRDKLPGELEVKSLDENKQSITQTYIKLPNPSDEYLESEAGKEAEKIVGLPGYMKVGKPSFTENTEFAQALRNLGPKPTDGDKEALDEWVFKHNTLVYGFTMAESIKRGGRPKLYTVINGLYNEDDKEVSIQYTENPEDVFMKGTEFQMVGWKELGKAKPDPTPNMGSTIEIYNKADNSMQKIEYVGGDASFTDHLDIVHEGYRKLGDPTEIKVDSISLQTTYDDQGREIRVYYTGNPEDNANGDIGWKQIGEAKKVTDDWSFKDALQVIDEAIAAGTTINERQYEQGRFSFMQGENALAMKMSEALNAYDKFVIMVRDFKFMKVDEVIDGKPTGKQIPATAGAIEAIAEATGKSVREIRLGLLERYNARVNK
jgi:hypothetical protein